MYCLSKNIKKIIKDANGYSFLYETDVKNQQIYQKINESAYIILLGFAKGLKEKDIVSTLQQKYRFDLSIEDKMNSFVNKLKSWNLLVDKKDIYYPTIIENSDIVVPKYCIIEISSNCLLNCSHCYLGKKQNSFVNTVRIIELIKELSILGIDSIQLTGGEPFLHPDFEKIINILIEKNIKTIITTSGYIPETYEKRLLLLQKLKNSSFIQVSIDGLEDTHNRIRGKNDSYQKTVNFIDRMIANNLEVQIATVVQRKNFSEMESLVKKFKLMGVRGIRFTGLMEAGFGKKEEIIDNGKITEVAKELGKKYADASFSIISSEESINVLENRKTPNCGCGSELFTIDTELNLYNCVMYRKPVANLTQCSFSDVLKKISINNFSIKAPNNVDCLGCEKQKKCFGCITLGRIEHDKTPCIWGTKWNL